MDKNKARIFDQFVSAEEQANIPDGIQKMLDAIIQGELTIIQADILQGATKLLALIPDQQIAEAAGNKFVEGFVALIRGMGQSQRYQDLDTTQQLQHLFRKVWTDTHPNGKFDPDVDLGNIVREFNAGIKQGPLTPIN